MIAPHPAGSERRHRPRWPRPFLLSVGVTEAPTPTNSREVIVTNNTPLVTAWLLGGTQPEAVLSAADELLAVALRRPSWHHQGACRGPENRGVEWFPQRGEDPEPARAVCSGCPVRERCLEHALEAREVGVWGGTTDRERTALRRARRDAA